MVHLMRRSREECKYPVCLHIPDGLFSISLLILFKSSSRSSSHCIFLISFSVMNMDIHMTIMFTNLLSLMFFKMQCKQHGLTSPLFRYFNNSLFITFSLFMIFIFFRASRQFLMCAFLIFSLSYKPNSIILKQYSPISNIFLVSEIYDYYECNQESYKQKYCPSLSEPATATLLFVYFMLAYPFSNTYDHTLQSQQYAISSPQSNTKYTFSSEYFHDKSSLTFLHMKMLATLGYASSFPYSLIMFTQFRRPFFLNS